MIIYNIELIREHCIKYHQCKGAMNVWESKVKSSSWANFSDIKNMFRSADYVDGLVIFNIQGNNHRLVIEAAFHEGAVAIKWVGTHADYDKKCKKGGFKL